MNQQDQIGFARHQMRTSAATTDFEGVRFLNDPDGSADTFIAALGDQFVGDGTFHLRQNIMGNIDRIKFKHKGEKFVVRPGDVIMIRNYHDGDPTEAQFMSATVYNRFFEQVDADGSNRNRWSA